MVHRVNHQYAFCAFSIFRQDLNYVEKDLFKKILKISRFFAARHFWAGLSVNLPKCILCFFRFWPGPRLCRKNLLKKTMKNSQVFAARHFRSSQSGDLPKMHILLFRFSDRGFIMSQKDLLKKVLKISRSFQARYSRLGLSSNLQDCILAFSIFVFIT